MELAQEHVLPERIDLILWVRVRLAALTLGAVDRSKSRDELEVVQENLGLAVVALDRAVRGRRTSVQLEVQFRNPVSRLRQP